MFHIVIAIVKSIMFLQCEKIPIPQVPLNVHSSFTWRHYPTPAFAHRIVRVSSFSQMHLPNHGQDKTEVKDKAKVLPGLENVCSIVVPEFWSEIPKILSIASIHFISVSSSWLLKTKCANQIGLSPQGLGCKSEKCLSDGSIMHTAKCLQSFGRNVLFRTGASVRLGSTTGDFQEN